MNKASRCISALLALLVLLESTLSAHGDTTADVPGLLPLVAAPSPSDEPPAGVGEPAAAVVRPTASAAAVPLAAKKPTARRGALPDGVVATPNVPSYVQPTGPPASVVLYLRCRFLGRKAYTATGNVDLTGTLLDHRVRSLTVPSGYKVTLYDGANWTGNTLVLTQSSSCLPTRWARTFSSMTLELITSGGGGGGGGGGGSDGGSGGGGGGGGGGDGGSTSVAEQLLPLVNQARQAAGLRPLKLDTRLIAAAQAHSNDQAKMRQMSHVGSDGSKFTDRINRTGYTWSMGGENVAYGYPTVAEVFNAWMNSPGHRANILNANFGDMGAASATSSNTYVYWTQVFAAPL